MSGGGGGSGGPAIDTRIRCDQLRFETELQSVKPAAARTVRPGDILSLKVKGPQGPIVATNRQGQEVGSIVMHIAELLRCIEAGFSYSAQVSAVQIPLIRVRIGPTSP